MASNGTVQAKTWNPNGLVAVANLPCTPQGAPILAGNDLPLKGLTLFSGQAGRSSLPSPACQRANRGFVGQRLTSKPFCRG